MLNCLVKQTNSPFPERHCQMIQNDGQTEKLPIFCICALPVDKKLMVQ